MDPVELFRQRFESEREAVMQTYELERAADMEAFREVLPTYTQFLEQNGYEGCFYTKWQGDDYVGARLFDYSFGGHVGAPLYVLFDSANKTRVIYVSPTRITGRDNDGTELEGDLVDLDAAHGSVSGSIKVNVVHLQRILDDRAKE